MEIVLYKLEVIGVSTDSRFGSEDNGFRGGILDIRILRPGFEATMIRVDQQGLSILTPGKCRVHSNGTMVLKSDSNMILEAETLIVQGREVLKEILGSI